MGKYDSSRTRVAPVFNWLYCRDTSGRTWVPQLLELVEARLDRPLTKALKQARWWPHEMALPAPAGLLSWLVGNCEAPADIKALGSGPARAKRELLLKRDEAVRREALAALAGPRVARAWYTLEGASQPDAYLSTDDVVIVIEGKRTELGPTTHTTWMPERHQILRHLDAAWETRGNRQLIGLAIVEGAGDGKSVPDHWRNYRRHIESPEVLAKSLPHRSERERSEILQAFRGVTTWQAVLEKLAIPNVLLIPSVEDSGS